MNASTLALVDPNIAQMALDDRARHIHRYTVEREYPTDFHDCKLQVEFKVKETPVANGVARGLHGVDYDAAVAAVNLVSPDGRRKVALPVGFIDTDEYALELEMELEAEQFDP